MALGLPAPKYSDRIKKHTQVKFGGLLHSAACRDGQIYDMTNMCGDSAPVIASRTERKLYAAVPSPHGIYANDALAYVSGTSFYYGGTVRGTVTASDKEFATLGAYIIIFPDKAYYNVLSSEFGSLENTYSGAAGQISFANGTYAEVAADGCALITTGAAFTFRVGDAVTISGCTAHAENNKTPIIREIQNGGKTLVFYENTFTTGTESGSVTISRSIPALEHICVNNNRLWGTSGDELFASKLGDPFNFNCFDGIASDSYNVSVGSRGGFTATVSYLGYPIFFKEDMIYKVYGSKPSNFEVISSASLGVLSGGSRSLAVAGEVLYYLSRVGIVAYSGGIPQSVSDAFGDMRFTQAAGGSDGARYYVSMYDGAQWRLCVYTPSTGLWHIHDGTNALGMCFCGGALFVLCGDGSLFSYGGADASACAGAGTSEGEIASVCEFGDITQSDPNRKGIAKLQFRFALDAAAAVTVKISYDGGEYMTVKRIVSPGKQSYYLPVIPRRCDHMRVKIEGAGRWELHSMTAECYSGSEL